MWLELSRRDRVQPEPIRVRQYLLTFIEEFARNEARFPVTASPWRPPTT